MGKGGSSGGKGLEPGDKGAGGLCCSRSVNSVGQDQVFVFNSHHSSQGSGGGERVADTYI